MDDDVAALVVDNGSGKFREIREQSSSTKKHKGHYQVSFHKRNLAKLCQ